MIPKENIRGYTTPVRSYPLSIIYSRKELAFKD